MKQFFVLLVALLLLASPAFASVGVQEGGVAVGQATDINFKGAVEVDKDGAVEDVNMQSPIIEESSTPDTVTVAEGGATFWATSNQAGGRTFDLPEITGANNGLTYRFVGGGRMGAVGSGAPNTENRMIKIHAQDDNAIFMTNKGTDGASIAALTGDVGSDCYPTVTLRAFAGNWYVTESDGTWATGS